MKNFQQNLLIVLAIGLCGLCAWQWYGQTQQRNEIHGLNEAVHEKSTSIQGYTNSLKTMDGQIAQMDARITELKETVKNNDQVMLSQKHMITELESMSEALTNQISQYKLAFETLDGKLKEAYDGVRKQNESITNLVKQRDELVQKLNDSVKERNDVVKKYNDLVERIDKLQAGFPKPKQ